MKTTKTMEAKEIKGGGVTSAHLPRLARSRDDVDRVWRLSEQLTGVTYPP